MLFTLISLVIIIGLISNYRAYLTWKNSKTIDVEACDVSKHVCASYKKLV